MLGGFPERWPPWRTAVAVGAGLLPFTLGTIAAFIAARGGGLHLGAVAKATAEWLAIAAIVAPRGGLDRVRGAVWRLGMRRHREQPWTLDRWNPRGASRLLLPPPSAQVLVFTAWLVFLFFGGVGGPQLAAAAGIAAGVLSSVWLWRHYRRFAAGRVHVAYTRFPYAVGEPAELHVGLDDGAPAVAPFDVALLCERPWPHPARLVVESQRGGAAGAPFRLEPGADVAVRIDVPADAPPTCTDPLARCAWWLEVRGSTESGNVEVRLPVPIYGPA